MQERNKDQIVQIQQALQTCIIAHEQKTKSYRTNIRALNDQPVEFRVDRRNVIGLPGCVQQLRDILTPMPHQAQANHKLLT